jgi:signal transduction histidine kinase
MTRLWRGSLAAQFIFFMLFALALSQGLGLLISWGERGHALRAQAKAEFFSRTASLALLLETTPKALHADILRVSATSYTRFWISAEEPQGAASWRKEALAQLAHPLPTLSQSKKPAPMKADVVAAAGVLGVSSQPDAGATDWLNPPAWIWPLPRRAKYLYLNSSKWMGLAVPLADGSWLSAANAKPLQNTGWTSQSAWSLAVTALALCGLAVFVARAISRPMRRLAAAAELLGRGEPVPPLPESGPDDIRQTAVAFNRMQERLQRFVEDRTRMLAAISHDLRTPLTSLRLRAEFVTDPELQDKMLKTISEIEGMTEAALAFARQEAVAEAVRTVDLAALIESLCEDLREIGLDVTYLDGPKLHYRCRSDGLRRAIRNLIENAVRYGDRARVRLTKDAEQINVIVEDDGPGIPENAMEQVFTPFFRLEHSRNRQTGGVGLGLSIARTIARQHGGDIVLSNMPKGLRAVITLPWNG